MKRIWIVLGLLLGLLSACSANSTNVENARLLLDAINRGDTEMAQDLLCEEDAEDTLAGIGTVGTDERQTWVMQNINCSAAGQDVRCTYDITMQMEDGTQQTTTADVVFNVEDGKICGFEEPIGE